MPDIDAVETIYQSLGALPDPEYGTINLLPWAQESDDTNLIKRRVCEAIVRVFEEAGYSFSREELPPTELRRVAFRCRSCGTTLVSAGVDRNGDASVPGAVTLSALSRMSPDCPHQEVTLDDQRLLIEQAVMAEQ